MIGSDFRPALLVKVPNLKAVANDAGGGVAPVVTDCELKSRPRTIRPAD
jgi:hypothetical protein